jgi:hypothetical protein
MMSIGWRRARRNVMAWWKGATLPVNVLYFFLLLVAAFFFFAGGGSGTAVHL